MQLTPKLREQLDRALLSAFKSRTSLKRLLLFGVGVELDTIVGEQVNLADSVFEIVSWVVASGRLGEFLMKARQPEIGNPGNPELSEAVAAIVRAAVAPPGPRVPPAADDPLADRLGGADELLRLLDQREPAFVEALGLRQWLAEVVTRQRAGDELGVSDDLDAIERRLNELAINVVKKYTFQDLIRLAKTPDTGEAADPALLRAYTELSPRQQRRFRMLGAVEPSRFDRELLEALWRPASEAELAEDIAALVTWRLIEAFAAPGAGERAGEAAGEWYQQPGDRNRYARALLEGTPELELAQQRHAQHYVGLVGAGQWSRLSLHELQIRRAWGVLVAEKNRVLIFSFLSDAAAYLARRRRWDELLSWAEAAQPFADTDARRMLCHAKIGSARLRRRELEQAGAAFVQQLALAKKLGDARAEAEAHLGLGAVSRMTGAFDDARRELEVAQRTFEGWADGGGLRGLAETLMELAQLFQGVERYEQAWEYIARAVTIAGQSDDPLAHAAALALRGSLFRARGQLDLALQDYQESRRLHQADGDRPGEASVLSRIGDLLRGQGKIAEARAIFEESRSIIGEFGTNADLAEAQYSVGKLLRAQGDIDAALSEFAAAKQRFELIPDALGQALVWNDEGVAKLMTGDEAGAQAALERAEDLAQESGAVSIESRTLLHQAVIRLRQGQLQQAFDLYQRSYRLQAGDYLSDARSAATTLVRMAGIRARLGEWAAALDLYAQAQAMAQDACSLENEAAALYGVSQVLKAQGRVADAKAAVQRALALYGAAGAVVGEQDARQLQAELEQLPAQPAGGG